MAVCDLIHSLCVADFACLRDVTRSDDIIPGILQNNQPRDDSLAKGLAMWLPTPIYESLPYVYILCGALFFFGTLYIGVTAPGATLYIATGLISIVYGSVVFVLRQEYRMGAIRAEAAEAV